MNRKKWRKDVSVIFLSTQIDSDSVSPWSNVFQLWPLSFCCEFKSFPFKAVACPIKGHLAAVSSDHGFLFAGWSVWSINDYTDKNTHIDTCVCVCK